MPKGVGDTTGFEVVLMNDPYSFNSAEGGAKGFHSL